MDSANIKEVFDNAQVIACNRIRAIFTDKSCKTFPDVTYSMSTRCRELGEKILAEYKDLEAWKVLNKRNVRTFQEVRDAEARRQRALAKTKTQQKDAKTTCSTSHPTT